MKIDRIISIIMILLDKERISAQKLANMFEVSLRTIYRDIDTIAMAGVPIHATSGVNGGFEIMPNFKIEKTFFSPTDLSTILIGLSSLSNMVQSNDLVNTLTKIKSFIPIDQAKNIELRTNQIHIDLSSWMGNKDIPLYLEIIKTALDERKLLFFDYIDRYGNRTSRVAEPYQLVLKSSHWYWQGYCRKRNDFRLFRLSRMTNLQIQEKTFIPKDYQNPQLDFNNILTTLQIKIKLRIHKSILDQLLDYCGHECFSQDNEEHYIVVFPFIENDYYYNILFSFGDKCECLEPLHIRKEIKRRIHNIGVLYER